MFINHLQFQCADFDASARFYDSVLGVLGASRLEDMSPYAIGYGTEGPEFWIGNHDGGPGFRESHVAFCAATTDAVDAFVEAARGLGYEVLHEPREWPEYYGGPVVGYYAGFVRDPDGNNVEATFTRFDFSRIAAETPSADMP